MLQMFSTDLIPAADRIDAWEWNARPFCGDCRFQFPNRRTFHGSIASRKLGGLGLWRFSSSSLFFQKFPTEVARPENSSCTVITQLEGSRWYMQNGMVVILKPGDSTLIDSAAPWSSDCLGDCARLYLCVPRWIMEERLRTATIPTAHRISGTTTSGASLFHMASSLYREADALGHEESAAMLEAYFDILSECLGLPRRAAAAAGESDLLSRLETFIEGHLAEPALGPAEVAAAAGISVRHAHRLFSRKGCTMGEWVRQRRLEQCRSDLADPCLRERSITDIAFDWGFSESAHFSRSFKQQFGVCPRTFRSQVWSHLWSQRESSRRAPTFVASTGFRHSQPN